MDIIYLLWWWALIPTIISAGTLQKKQVMISSLLKSSPLQPQIQPKYQPLAAASGPTNNNGDNLENLSPGKQSEVASSHVISEKLEINPEKQVESQQQAPSHQAIRDVTNVEIEPQQEGSPSKQTEHQDIVSSDIVNLEVSSSKQSQEVSPSKVINLEANPSNQSDPEQNSSDQAVRDVRHLDVSPGKQSIPDEAPSGQGISDVTNFENSDGKQLASGGSALSRNIGENAATADERPSRIQVLEGAPAPVDQPTPPPPPTVQPLEDDKNKTKNGTGSGNNTTIGYPDIEDIKEGAKGKSFQDTVAYQDLKSVNMRLENLGGGNEYSCRGNRGPLRPLYDRSKYFVDKENRYTYEEGRTACHKQELVFAEIDSMSDFRSLMQYYNFQFMASTFNASADRFFIGLNDLEDEGVYVRSDASKILFQAYFTTQPDDKDGSEDCNVIGKEEYEGPMGMMDVSCFSKYYLLCMFPPDDTCINDTREANLHGSAMKHVGVHSLMDLPDRAYSVSDFQLPWEQAFDYCANQSMKMFDMDHMVTTRFFRTLYYFEDKLISEKVPVIQWWTAGRFKDSHMDAAVYWENEESVHSENMDQHRRQNKQNFTFSGIFRWNNYKGADPTGRLGKRKDVCLSFGFQLKPDDTPYVRNTNCGLPCYFVCSKDHETIFETPEITDEVK